MIFGTWNLFKFRFLNFVGKNIKNQYKNQKSN